MKKIQHAWHGDKRGGALLLDGVHDFARIARRFEDHRSSQERRNK